MFEMLKWIVELITKLLSVPQFMEMRNKEKLADLGTDLFLMYDSLTRVVAQGHSIVQAMTVAITDYERGVSTHDDVLHLRDLVSYQESLMDSFSEDLMRFRSYINAISPDSGRRLSRLIDGKSKSLRYLGHEILFLEQQQILYLENIITTTPYEDVHAIEVHATTERLDLQEAGFHLTPKIYAALKEHLQTGKQEQTLTALSLASDGLREAIIGTFSLEEILLRVAERIKRQTKREKRIGANR